MNRFNIFVYFIKTLAFLLDLLPRILFLGAGIFLGRLIHFLGFRSKIAKGNLLRVFPEKMEAEREAIRKKNYEHFGLLLLEFIRSFYGYKKFLETSCTVEGGEHLKNAHAAGRGVLVITSHQGNWEILTAAGAHLLKLPCNIVTKRLKPDWFHKLAEAERASLGVKMAFEPRTMNIVMRALRAKELVGFVMDQYVGAPLGARLPFFNIPVGTSIAPALLAVRTGAVIVPGYTIRNADGTFRARFEAPMSGATMTRFFRFFFAK